MQRFMRETSGLFHPRSCCAWWKSSKLFGGNDNARRSVVTYLAWLLVFAWLPEFLLVLFFGRILWQYRKTLAFCIAGSVVVSIPWDWWAISTGTWLFPPRSIIGVWFGGSPLEEYLFIVFVTLLISSITLVLRKLLGPYITG